MIVTYDEKLLESILYDISELTGITLSAYDYDGNHLADCMHGSLFCTSLALRGSRKLCSDCCLSLWEKSKQSLQYEECMCPMGLREACLPIIIDDVCAGFIAIAGIRTDESLKLGIFEDDNPSELYFLQPFYTEKQLKALKNIIPRILLNNAISIKYDDRLDEITAYIKNNLNEKLTIEHLCKTFSISKNSLYSLFEANLSTTVNEFITDQRIKKAKKLLEKHLSHNEILEQIGIENYSYFSRLFKKKTGITPNAYSKYR